MNAAGIRALALAFPPTVRTNDFWRTEHADAVANAEGRALAKLWSPSGDAAIFEQEMAPYMADPFRGTVERRVYGPGETSLAYEVRAARQALAAAGLQAADVDLALVSSFFPNQYDVGNGAFVARALGLQCAAWNLESACSSSMAALTTASALVRSGQQRNVLCVTSCNYSQMTEPADSLGWTVGDGAAAFVVSACDDGFGYLGGHAIHTAGTCGAMSFRASVGADGAPVMRMRAGEASGRLMKESSEKSLKPCVEGAARAAGVAVNDIDFFVFNTPLAWYASFCARLLEVDVKKTIDVYPRFANVGPVLMPANLHTAAQDGRIKRGDLVCLYSIGSVSSAAAVVVRWGDVALG